MTKAETIEQPALQMPTIDPGVRIGHVHLKVANLQRALDFYCGVLGFTLTTSRPGAAFISAGGIITTLGSILGRASAAHRRPQAPPVFTILQFFIRPGASSLMPCGV